MATSSMAVTIVVPSLISLLPPVRVGPQGDGGGRALRPVGYLDDHRIRRPEAQVGGGRGPGHHERHQAGRIDEQAEAARLHGVVGGDQAGGQDPFADADPEPVVPGVAAGQLGQVLRSGVELGVAKPVDPPHLGVQAVGFDAGRRDDGGEEAVWIDRLAQFGQVHAGGHVGGHRGEHVAAVERGAGQR